MTRIKVEDRREQLIDATLRVIARDGVAAASTRAIVAEAGMSLASFHYAFTSHDELMAKVVLRVTESESLATVTAMVDAGPEASLLDTLEAGFSAFLEAVVAYPQRELAMLELTQHALRTPKLKDLPARQYAHYYAAVEEMINLVATRQQCSWRLPTPELARFIVALTDGITLCWLATEDMCAARAIVHSAAGAVAALARPVADTAGNQGTADAGESTAPRWP